MQLPGNINNCTKRTDIVSLNHDASIYCLNVCQQSNKFGMQKTLLVCICISALFCISAANSRLLGPICISEMGQLSFLTQRFFKKNY